MLAPKNTGHYTSCQLAVAKLLGASLAYSELHVRASYCLYIYKGPNYCSISRPYTR